MGRAGVVRGEKWGIGRRKRVSVHCQEEGRLGGGIDYSVVRGCRGIVR